MPPAPHSAPSPSDAARDIAHRLFAREMRGEAGDVALIAAAERICTRVPEGLARWFGSDGSRALVARALALVRQDHPSLRLVTITAKPPLRLTGLSERAPAHGTGASADAIVGLLAALVELIGRLIGDDLAVSLLEQSMTTSVTEMTPAASTLAPIPPSAGRAPAAALSTEAPLPVREP